jgi:DNA-binding response OmpR family regulator
MKQLDHKRRILIIDDDEAICSMLRTFFETMGYQVDVRISSINLFQDLDSVRADVILLDVMMSWVDGYRVCEMLKSHPKTKDIPVLMISARSGAEDIRRGLAAKAEDYFVKPFNLSDLRGRIDQLLSNRPN